MASGVAHTCQLVKKPRKHFEGQRKQINCSWIHSKELPFKLSGVGERERSDFQVKCSKQTQPSVISKANEVSLILNNNEVTALLETGSMVNTISASLCAELQMSVQILDQGFCVKGAGGHDIPYLGVVETSTGCPNLELDGFQALMLVMPDTTYHSRVPVLLGTSVLNAMKDQVTVNKPQTIPANGKVRILGQTRVKAIIYPEELLLHFV